MTSVADTTNTAYGERDTVSRDPTPAESRGGFAAGATGRPAAVELADVAQRLGYRWALRGVTLRVEPGEVVAVVGPNGSGKTTLLRVVATTLTATRGSGRVFGYDLAREPDAVRERTGMLGHATGLYDDLSAAENLEFALRMCGRSPSPSAVAGALEAVGMRQHAGELVRRLSSGMRRRVALARLLLRRPRLLLLDEPYNSFDVAGIALVDELIRETARDGGAALVVTHDLARNPMSRYDRLVALNAGRVIENAPLGREATP
ncbi:MAG: heme ABC exporter ATP-binding protein CcmA [Gemmatimonadaceae bacterium]